MVAAVYCHTSTDRIIDAVIAGVKEAMKPATHRARDDESSARDRLIGSGHRAA